MSYLPHCVIQCANYHDIPDSKGILQKYMPLLYLPVSKKTVVPDLSPISLSQPQNLCRRICRAKLREVLV